MRQGSRKSASGIKEKCIWGQGEARQGSIYIQLEEYGPQGYLTLRSCKGLQILVVTILRSFERKINNCIAFCLILYMLGQQAY